jgi:hypothetical protein
MHLPGIRLSGIRFFTLPAAPVFTTIFATPVVLPGAAGLC